MERKFEKMKVKHFLIVGVIYFVISIIFMVIYLFV